MKKTTMILIIMLLTSFLCTSCGKEAGDDGKEMQDKTATAFAKSERTEQLRQRKEQEEQYTTAKRLVNDDRIQAKEIFVDLGEFSASAEWVEYINALELMEQKKYEEAKLILRETKLGDYENLLKQCDKMKKLALMLEVINNIDHNNYTYADEIPWFEEKEPDFNFEINYDESFDANLDRLFQTKLFKYNPHLMAEILVRCKCYEYIELGMLDTYNPNKRMKKSFETGISLPTFLPNAAEFYLLCMIKVAENPNDEAEYLFNEFRWFLANHKFPYFASIANTSADDPDCFSTYYSEDIEYQTPGKIKYLVLHAPERIKNMIQDMEPLLYLRNGPKRTYTKSESEQLFSNFTPSNPKDGGYILITNLVNPPESMALAGNDPKRYEFGNLFCATSPNNARYAIYEDCTFEFYGMYELSSGSGKRDVRVYTPQAHVTVVDLMTGEVVFEDDIYGNTKESYFDGTTEQSYSNLKDLSTSKIADALGTMKTIE